MLPALPLLANAGFTTISAAVVLIWIDPTIVRDAGFFSPPFLFVFFKEQVDYSVGDIRVTLLTVGIFAAKRV